MSDSPAEVFMKLVRGVSDRRSDELPGLYAPATDVVHPLDPLRAPALRSREELRRHFQGADGRRFDFQPHIRQIHQTGDPEVIVAEFEYRGELNGRPFAVPCVFVMRIRDGQIVESHDYVDHLMFARLSGRLDSLVEAIKARDQTDFSAS